KARTVVLDRAQHVRRLVSRLFELNSYRHVTVALTLECAMIDRILDQRLEQETRNEERPRLVRDLPAEAQGFAVARLEDLRIPMEPCQLLVDRLHLRWVAERVAEQIAQAAEQTPRLLGMFGHEARNRVQRIHEEMWLELRPQHGQLRRASQ